MNLKKKKLELRVNWLIMINFRTDYLNYFLFQEWSRTGRGSVVLWNQNQSKVKNWPTWGRTLKSTIVLHSYKIRIQN
jgi:hypothetical protein